MKERLDVLLVKLGYAPSREKAKAAIMAGLVFVKNQRVDKAGTKISVDAEIAVKGNPIPYVGRGGLKLEKAFVILISAAVLINYLAGVAGGQLYYDIPVVGDRVYFYYVLIGYYLFKYRKHIRVSQRMAVIISAVSLLITFGSSMWSTLSGNTHSDKMLAYSTPFMILSSVSFFLFMIRLNGANYTPSEKVRRVIDAFGKASFGIYLIHIFFLDIYRKFVPVTALPAWVAVPALTVVIAGMSFGCIWLLHRFKWGRMIS